MSGLGHLRDIWDKCAICAITARLAKGAVKGQLAEDCGVTKKTMSEAFSFLQEYWIELNK